MVSTKTLLLKHYYRRQGFCPCVLLFNLFLSLSCAIGSTTVGSTIEPKSLKRPMKCRISGLAKDTSRIGQTSEFLFSENDHQGGAMTTAFCDTLRESTEPTYTAFMERLHKVLRVSRDCAPRSRGVPKRLSFQIGIVDSSYFKTRHFGTGLCWYLFGFLQTCHRVGSQNSSFSPKLFGLGSELFAMGPVQFS